MADDVNTPLRKIMLNISINKENKTTAAVVISCRALKGRKYLFRDIHNFSFSA